MRAAESPQPSNVAVPAPGPGRRRRRLRAARVVSVDHLTPRTVRVTLGGEDLAGFSPQGPACHLKLFFPLPGQESLPPLVRGEDGPDFAPDTPRVPTRTYTPRAFDASTNQLVVDIVTHGTGLGSEWAERAQVGMAAVVSGPSAPYQVDPEAEWFLIAGDETAVPAIGTLLEHLPAAARGQVFIEVADEGEQLPFGAPSNVQVNWLYRNGSNLPTGRVLESAVQSSPLLETGNGRVWVATEAGVMRDIRQQLLQQRGVDKQRIVTRGYWKLGEANHPDHDYGED